MPPKKRKRQVNVSAKSPGRLEVYLRDNFNLTPVDELLNGHVLFVFIENNRSIPNTIQALLEKTSLSFSRASVTSLIRSIDKYKNLPRDMDILDKMCRQKFTFSQAQLELPTPPPPPDTSSGYSSRLEPEGSSASSSGSTLVPTPAASPSTSPPSSARHSSRDPLTPRKKKLRARLDFVSDSRIAMMKKHQNKLHQLKERLSKSVSLGHHNQAIQRKVETILRPRSERRNHQCGDVQVTLSKKLSKMRRNHRRLKKARLAVASSSSDVEKLKEQAGRLKAKDEEIRALQDEKLVLLDTVDQLKANSRVVTCKRDNKTYSTSTRMMVYDAVVEQVPTLNIPLFYNHGLLGWVLK